MRRIILAIGGAAVLAAVVAGIRRRSRGAVLARPVLLSESVVIGQPPEEVFAYVSDAEYLPEWTETTRKVRKEAEGPPRVGEQHTVIIGFLGRRFEQSFEVIAYEPPRRYSDRSRGGPRSQLVAQWGEDRISLFRSQMAKVELERLSEKEYERCSDHGFGLYKEGEIDRKALLRWPVSRRWKRNRDFSDNLVQAKFAEFACTRFYDDRQRPVIHR